MEGYEISRDTKKILLQLKDDNLVIAALGDKIDTESDGAHSIVVLRIEKPGR